MLAPRRGLAATLPTFVVMAAIVASCLLAASPVAAQLEAGRRALDEADFQRAVRAFDRAERTERLDRAGLVSLYEGRVIARFALGTRSRAQRDLEILGSLDPEHTFPVEVPPEVGEALATVVRRAGGGLAAQLTWRDDAAGSTLEVEVVRDVASLVRSVRVHTRVGDAPWSESSEREIHLPHAEGVAVAAWVEVLGERDVVLVSEGSAERPNAHGETRVVVAEPVLLIDTSPEAAASSDDTLAIALGVGLGGAALLAAAVVLGVVFGTQTSSDTQPTLTVTF